MADRFGSIDGHGLRKPSVCPSSGDDGLVFVVNEFMALAAGTVWENCHIIDVCQHD